MIERPTIVAGDDLQFAIAAKIFEIYDDWIFGSLRFVFHKQVCGNWEDSAHIKGCHGWLKDFAKNPKNRFEKRLLHLAPDAVWQRVVRPALWVKGQPSIPERYEHTYSRFHISHLGMSSFDRIVMILIEGPWQRCLWQDGEGGVIHDHMFPAGHMQKIAGEFCNLLETEVAALGLTI